MVVVPDEPLLEVDVLLLDTIGWMEVHVEATVLESVMEFLDLSVVLWMVGFIANVCDPSESAYDGESRAPFPATVSANAMDDERRTSNDVVQECNGTVLITSLEELGEREA